jgi:hypothetical protein
MLVFLLPLDVISSIDKENHGYVRYTCIAVLDLPEDGASEIISGFSRF